MSYLDVKWNRLAKTQVIFGSVQKCGGPMKVIERLTAAEIQLRSAPDLITVAAA